MKKVVKFGGSSLADAAQFRKVGDIIRADETRVYVVPSAPGKRFDGDVKVTDLLYRCHDLAAGGRDFSEPFAAVKERYADIVRELELSPDFMKSLEDEFQTIEEHLKQGPERDYIASRGEYLNGRILAGYLGFPFLDAAEGIFFDTAGTFDAERTNVVLSARNIQRTEVALARNLNTYDILKAKNIFLTESALQPIVDVLNREF